MRRRYAAAVLTLTAVLVASVMMSGPARADPVYPSKDDVRRAQRHAAAVGSQVSALQAQLTAASNRADAADLALSQAAENYDTARVELDRLRHAATVAAQVARRATIKLDAAQEQVGRLAAQAYRTGGSLASLDVLLSPKGPGDVLERASMIRILGEQRQQQVQRMDGARVVATTLDHQAAEALDRQAAAASKLERARAAAQQSAQAARSVLATEQATRTALLVKLAAAQKTSVTVERARQTGLAKAALAQQEAAQRRRAAAQEQARRRAEAERSRSGTGSETDSNSSGSDHTGSDDTSSDPGPGSGGGSSGSSSAGGQAVAWARQRVGLPYQWGGDGPGSYDCSGLVMLAWRRAGVGLPHSSRMQYRQVEKISYSRLRPGDLVFFATDPGNQETIHHVAMYIGAGRMIEAPYTGANVRIVALRTGDSMPYAGRP